MIVLKRISVEGTAGGDGFRGEMEFDAGFQVISAPNGFGKTSAVKAIAWCLGLEAHFGVGRNATSFFPEAIRDRIRLGERQEASVDYSVASLELQIGTGKIVVLRRPIVGGDPSLVECTIASETVTLIAGGLKDETGGLQRQLFDWLSFPVHYLRTRTGGTAPIYIENLSSLFLVEQIDGWSEIQGRQIQRYGQIDIEPACVEYTLGLDDRLEHRLAEQESEAREAKLRRDGGAILEGLNELLGKQGWIGEIKSRRGIPDLQTKFGSLRIRDFLRDKFNWDYENERERLASLRRRLQADLKTLKTSSDSRLTARKSTALISLKERIHANQQKLRTLRTQLDHDRGLLETIEARRQSARDLLRLKKRRIGIGVELECPTCQRVLSPEDFELHVQSADELERHAETLDAERGALREGINAIERDVSALAHELEKNEAEYAQARTHLEMVGSVADPIKETLLDLASRLMKVEREERENAAISAAVGELEEMQESWLVDAKALETPDAARAKEEQKTRRLFQKTVGQFLGKLKHGALAEGRENELELDDEYVPVYGGRPLRWQGSGSDPAREVLAYTLALQRTALERSGHHPGFCVLDEPFQQNPDEKHKRALGEFLAATGTKIPGQVLILTYLNRADKQTLSGLGVEFRSVDEERWLRPI